MAALVTNPLGVCLWTQMEAEETRRATKTDGLLLLPIRNYNYKYKYNYKLDQVNSANLLFEL